FSLLSFAHWFISPITEYSLNYCLDYGVHFTDSIRFYNSRVNLNFLMVCFMLPDQQSQVITNIIVDHAIKNKAKADTAYRRGELDEQAFQNPNFP
ncbi:MAG: hypothetical protein KZQ58_10080, partial [gamma proteobacterium symbiont of Bathyaustriella thionipta]|nr:hypothetical protein [gamma proteobacterium symbiont of Bathyaustriella thionipta]